MVHAAQVTFPRRGEVCLTRFDPTVGAEVRKTRPALVIQNDVSNRYSPVTIVAAITSRVQPPLYPTEVLVQSGEGGLRVPSLLLLHQVRTIDKRRLLHRLGALKPRTLAKVDQALRVSLGLVEL